MLGDNSDLGATLNAPNMAMIRSYQDLIIWQKAMVLAKAVYGHTSQFPKSETYGLTAQMRRAAVSVPSNTAEGHARNGTGEFKYHLGISKGSLAELETLILLSKELEYITLEKCNFLLSLSTEVNKPLNGLLRSLSKHRPP